MITRRGMLKGMLLTGLGLLARPLARAAETATAPESTRLLIPLSSAEELKQVGGFTILKVKGEKILFIRDTEQSVRALSSRCTHLGGKLRYEADVHQIHCPYHGSRFNLDGSVINGPAKKPLQTWPAALQGDQISIDLGA
jgi:cytochrome b6-f complex iron-sulfur subunit